MERSSAAAVGAGMLSGLPLSASAFVDGSDVIKVALVGCGGRGTGAASQALATGKDVRLVAMADAFQDRLDTSLRNLLAMDEIKDQIDVKDDTKFVGFDAYKHAIEAADVVLFATPPGFRPIHVAEAIAQNKHVFMEKPVAVDAPGIRSILDSIKKAREKKLSVVAGLQQRFMTNYTEKAVEMIQTGGIGELVGAQCYWNIGAIRWPERKDEKTEMEYQMRNWYHFPWLSGDHIEDTHIHNLDVCNWVIQGYPVKAQGMGGRAVPYTPGHYGAMFDHHYIEFTYENGLILNSQCRQISGTFAKLGEFFIGSEGTASTNRNDSIIKDRNGKTKYAYLKLRHPDEPNSQQVEHDLLFAAIRSGKPKNDAEYAAYSTMTAIMGRMASYTGQEVTWDEAFNSEVSLTPSAYTWDADPPILPGPDGSYPLPVPGVSETY